MPLKRTLMRLVIKTQDKNFIIASSYTDLVELKPIDW